MVKKCLICNINFTDRPRGKRKYCSIDCTWKSFKGKSLSEERKNKIKEAIANHKNTKLAHKMSEEGKLQMILEQIGRSHSPKTQFKKGSMGHFKNGKTIQRGYIKIYVPNHPFNKNNYVYEHRLVMEKMINRFLYPEEVVHHINGIKTDNSPGNLLYFSCESEHQKFHNSYYLNMRSKIFKTS